MNKKKSREGKTYNQIMEEENAQKEENDNKNEEETNKEGE